jgi:hypothetical protein
MARRDISRVAASNQKLSLDACFVRLKALVQLLSDKAEARSGELNLVLSKNPPSKSRRTTTVCCSTAFDNLKKLFDLFVDSRRPILVSKFQPIRSTGPKWTERTKRENGPNPGLRCTREQTASVPPD